MRMDRGMDDFHIGLGKEGEAFSPPGFLIGSFGLLRKTGIL